MRHTATGKDIEDSVENFAHIHCSWTTADFGGKNQRFEDVPLFIG